MNPELAEAFATFVNRVRERMEAGARTYGERSLNAEPVVLLNETQGELEDVCGWAAILWWRLNQLHESADTRSAEGVTAPRGRESAESEAGLRVTSVALTNASTADIRTGLLGWVTCVLNDTLVLDGIALRRTADGRLTLSFPARRDRAGNQYPYVRPIDDAARQHLEGEIFKALRLDLEETAS